MSEDDQVAKGLGNMPALPVLHRTETWDGNDGCKISNHESYGGLSKRERFAMAAMQGMCAEDDWYHTHPEGTARRAVELADALLKELANG